MVDVAHNGDDRWAILEVFVVVFNSLNHVFHVGVRNTDDLVAEFFDDQFGCIGVNRLVLSRHDAVGHERLYHVGNTFRHPVGQFLHGNRSGSLTCA